jgi:hypothetical protein
MLFDPVFVARVYADPDTALAGVELTASERANLTAVDRRAWGHDPLRRYRTLRTLSEEYKATTTLVLAATRSLASLDAFFSSDEFHRTVQHRGRMALAFSEFVARIAAERPIDTPQLPDVLRLETMLARCRRDAGDGAAPKPSTPSGPDTRIALAPGHAIDRFNVNVVAAVNVAERYLFEIGLMPAVALCEDAPRLDALPELSTDPVFLLALPGASGVSLMPVDGDYFALLEQFARGPLRRSAALSRTVDRGVEREDVVTMLESLVDEGVLVPV